MSKLRKAAATALSLSLTFAVTACSSGGGGGNASGSASPAGSPAASPTASGSASAVPVADTPGWKSNTDPITFDWYVNFSWASFKWGENLVSKLITKKTGVSINFMMPSGNENEKMNTMIASGKLPDFITIDYSADAVQQMIDGGLVLPLNELAEQYDPYFFKAADPLKLSWYQQPDGNTYGYPNSSVSPKDYEKYGDEFTSNQTFVVRKDMYEAIGKPDMRTPDGFLNALRAAKEKFPTVDGQPLIPLGLTEFLDTGAYAFLNQANNQSMLMNFLAIPMGKDGNVYDRVTDPEFIKWLKVFRQAYQEGLLPKDAFVDKQQQLQEKLDQGRYFAMLNQIGDFAGQQWDLYTKDPNSVYIPVDGPADANLDPPTLSGQGISGWTLTLISKNVKDKARAIQFLTYLISEEGQQDTFLGEKGVTWDTIDGKDQFLQSTIDYKNQPNTDYWDKYGTEGSYWMLTDYTKTLDWAMPLTEPTKTAKEWTLGKVHDFSAFERILPTGSSDLGQKANEIALLWGKTLPKLLTAKSDAEFDQIFADFTQKRADLGFDEVMAYEQQQYEANLKKLQQ